MMTDDWSLIMDDWWLIADDWWLMIDDWWLMSDEWWLMIDDKIYTNIKWNVKYRLPQGGSPLGANNMGPISYYICIYFIINHQSSLITHQSSVINHQLSIINHPWSMINHQSSIIIQLGPWDPGARSPGIPGPGALGLSLIHISEPTRPY